jgi:hypothetical protein
MVAAALATTPSSCRHRHRRPESDLIFLLCLFYVSLLSAYAYRDRPERGGAMGPARRSFDAESPDLRRERCARPGLCRRGALGSPPVSDSGLTPHALDGLGTRKQTEAELASASAAAARAAPRRHERRSRESPNPGPGVRSGEQPDHPQVLDALICKDGIIATKSEIGPRSRMKIYAAARAKAAASSGYRVTPARCSTTSTEPLNLVNASIGSVA